MNPRAIEGVEVVVDGAEGLTLRHPQRGEVQLRGVAAAVWRHIDGARSPEELAAAVGAETDAVWAALDELGDAELLTERVSPPEGIHENVRREVVFAAEAATGAEVAGQLEAQFDAEAAKDGQDIALPQAEERRKQQEAAQEAEAAAAAAAAMAELDGRSDDGESGSR